MFMYRSYDPDQVYVRQGDIPKGVQTTRIDVPSDINGLANFLNTLFQVQNQERHSLSEERPAPLEFSTLEQDRERLLTEAHKPIRDTTDPDEPSIPPPVVKRDMGAEAVLARTDAGFDIDLCCERITKSRGHVLARFAKCVAVAYEGLKA